MMALFLSELERALREAGCSLCRIVRRHEEVWLFHTLWEFTGDPRVRQRFDESFGLCSSHARLLIRDEGLSEDVARKRVSLGEWPAPPEVQELLRRERMLPSLSLRELLRRALRRSRDGDLREELERAIAFLERYGAS